MKVISFLIVIVSSFLSYHVSAQHRNIGLKGGLNTRELSSTFDDLMANYQIGVYGYHTLGKKLTLQGEVNYIVKSFEESEDSWKVRGVQFPVLLEYKLYNPLFIQSGVQHNVLEAAEKNAEVLDKDTLSNYFTAFVGIGIELPSGFEFSTRYYFLDFANQPVANPLMTSLLQVSVGFDVY